MKIAILRDSNPDYSLKWEIACQNKGLEFLVIDMLRNDCLEILKDFNPSFCVCRPPGDIQQSKKTFDEKLFFIEKYTPYKVFPGFHESLIYENKAVLAYFLEVNNIPHPNTFVSYSKNEALSFLKNTTYPVVAKTLIGAAGSGVKIIKSHSEAKEYVERAFKKGIKRRFGPNRKTGSPKSWLKKAFNSPKYFFKKLKEYRLRNKDIQKGVVLFQEYISHEFEWRCVKIGDSFFGYKKLKIGEKASGAKEFEYGAPPFELLDFTKNICDKFKFNFMAIDVFFNNQKIYVNEMQTIFGHKNPYICKVNEKQGRYFNSNNQWLFEEGDFNTNESFDLRLETAIRLYNTQKQ